MLTLTATPIPRTLHLSLAGLRDMTLMQTPPRDRSPVLDLRRAVGRRPDRRGHLARARSRRTGLLRAQSHRDHRGDRRPHQAHRPARADRRGARADARARARGRACIGSSNGEIDVLVSTMIVESGSTCRTRTRCSSIAPITSASRSCTSCAVASAARTVAPTATCSCPTRGGSGRGAPAAGARASHRARRGLPDRAQGSRDARGGKSARRRAVGLRARGRVRPVSADARGDGAAADARRRGAASPLPSDVTIDMPTYPARRLRGVAGRQARRLQAAGALRDAAGDRGDARRSCAIGSGRCRRRPRRCCRSHNCA